MIGFEADAKIVSRLTHDLLGDQNVDRDVRTVISPSQGDAGAGRRQPYIACSIMSGTPARTIGKVDVRPAAIVRRLFDQEDQLRTDWWYVEGIDYWRIDEAPYRERLPADARTA
jgi:hypothetical protein